MAESRERRIAQQLSGQRRVSILPSRRIRPQQVASAAHPGHLYGPYAPVPLQSYIPPQASAHTYSAGLHHFDNYLPDPQFSASDHDFHQLDEQLDRYNQQGTTRFLQDYSYAAEDHPAAQDYPEIPDPEVGDFDPLPVEDPYGYAVLHEQHQIQLQNTQQNIRQNWATQHEIDQFVAQAYVAEGDHQQTVEPNGRLEAFAVPLQTSSINPWPQIDPALLAPIPPTRPHSASAQPFLQPTDLADSLSQLHLPQRDLTIFVADVPQQPVPAGAFLQWLDVKMVGKKSGKALLREEGLERTDNGMKQSSWPEPPMINQKNYYTDYMKRDDQILPFRLQNEANREKMIRNAKDKDRALARTGNTDVPIPTSGEGDPEEDEDGSNDSFDATKTIVIHPGSQNLRIGFASDALPKTIPMCIASKYPVTESEEYEARPKRQKLDLPAEEFFGEEFSKKFKKMSDELKVDMRANKRKVLPNSKELVIKFNKHAYPEEISEHNDPLRIEWTDISGDDPKDISSCFTGFAAQRIPDDSTPKYKLFWPIQHGWFHEEDYTGKRPLYEDFDTIIEMALRNELGLKRSSEWEQYSCVFVIPDLYDKQYVEQALHISMRSIEFKQVCFIQESLAATFGAGFGTACIVDVGAQKTSICCVEDGMLIEDSRVNLKYGGYDVTETFIKMMLHDSFNYDDINLKRRYDFLLAEELKIKCCTMNQVAIVVQPYDFHLRAPNQPTRKYNFRTYDEVILASMGFFDPTMFDNSDKLNGRRKWIDRSYNAYEGADQPDDPNSSAQLSILTSIKPSLATAVGFPTNGNINPHVSTPSKEKPNPFLSRMDIENGTSRVTSTAGSPAPEGINTPVPSGPFVFGANGTNGGSPGPSFATQMFNFGNGSHNSGTPVPPAGMFVDPMARTQQDLAIERDSVLPIAPLDTAILTSITHGAKGDDKKARDFFGGIMVIGGGAKIPNFSTVLEEKLKAKRPDLAEKILVGVNPKEMDGQVVTWKGASVFARMTTNDSWIVQEVYEKLGSRAIQQKVLWYY